MVTTFEFPGLQERRHKQALGILLLLSLTHIATTWGEIDIFIWRDAGRWLHEMERFAEGEIPYRDYVWLYPPLALWAIGAIARAFGSDVQIIWAATSIVCLLIYLSFFQYVSALVRRPLVAPVVVGGFLLSAGYANYQSAPLPMGMYTPATPIGFLLILSALLSFMRLSGSGSRRYATAMGVLLALSILTKHDFWAPALYLLIAGCVLLWRQNSSRGWRLVVWVLGSFASIFLAGVSIIIGSADRNVLPGILSGFGNFAEVRSFGFPSWQRITVDVGALAILGTGFLVLLAAARMIQPRSMRKWFLLISSLAILCCMLHVGMGYKLGRVVEIKTFAGIVTLDAQRLLESVGELKFHLQLHLLPLALPISLSLIVICNWRRAFNTQLRNTVAFLLGLSIAARARRGFEYVEWYQFLLEIPAYICTAELYFPALKKEGRLVVNLAMVMLIILGCYSYWYWGVGMLTRKDFFQKLQTPKGVVYVSPEVAHEFREINRILQREDPGVSRPLFAFGYSGGFNYFLDRKNPAPITAGFRMSNFSPPQVVSELLQRSPAPFLLDNEHFKRGSMPAPDLDFRHWYLRKVQTYYMRFDRPYFEQLLSNCNKLAEIHTLNNEIKYTIHDCQAVVAKPATAVGHYVN